ncbi:MAG: hypothetical protein HOE69_04755 [Euryarchaeota archaeon]|nr:hypothetical protein [Euryarchaeota archaeon]
MAKKSKGKKKQGFFSRKAKTDSKQASLPTATKSPAVTAPLASAVPRVGDTSTRIRKVTPSLPLRTTVQVVDASATDSDSPRASAGVTSALLEAAGERVLQMTPTLDENLWTGSRIMVPVDVQALVVPRFSDHGEGLPLMNGESSGDDKSSSLMHGDLEPGIHLHWAMPDGLLSDVPTESEEDGYVDSLPHTATIGVEQPVEVADETIELRPLPDRWLVVRFWPASYHPTNESTQLKRVADWNTESWVINAADATRSSLATWRAPPLPPQESEWPLELTALGPDGDDPYWTARYDSVRERFTFHDVPPDNVIGPLNYLVCGWYSNHTEDPLWFPPGASMDDWEKTMDELGWNVWEQLIQDALDARGGR